jgi:hypothetical protein
VEWRRPAPGRVGVFALLVADVVVFVFIVGSHLPVE